VCVSELTKPYPEDRFAEKKMSPKFIAKYDKTSFWNALKDKSGS